MKSPPANILPSGCTAIEYTSLNPLKPLLTLNVLSIVPPVFSLIILLLVTPLYDVKLPPANILPSGCNVIVLTKLLNPLNGVVNVPVSNVLSIVPPVFNLMMKLLLTLL